MKQLLFPQVMLDVIRFSVTPTSSAKTVIFDGLTPPFAGMVDWGDGTVSPLVSATALSHTYTDTTTRQIAVRGVVGGFWNTTGSTGKNLVVSLDEISAESLVTMQNMFRGCTALRSLPDALRIPNVANFNYTFYQNRSIISNLTPLWLTHAAKPHSGCFTDCFKSLYSHYGSSCSYRQYVSAVPGQTYFQRYGQSGCPAATYHAATQQQTYIEHYGTPYSCPNESMTSVNIPVRTHAQSCPWAGKSIDQALYCSAGCNSVLHPTCKCGVASWSIPTWNCSFCNIIYSSASPAYYSCSHFGGNCKTSGCTRAYSSGQSAYYRCTRSGGTCQDSSCPYPYANETSYNNARTNGWA